MHQPDLPSLQLLQPPSLPFPASHVSIMAKLFLSFPFSFSLSLSSFTLLHLIIPYWSSRIRKCNTVFSLFHTITFNHHQSSPCANGVTTEIHKVPCPPEKNGWITFPLSSQSKPWRKVLSVSTPSTITVASAANIMPTSTSTW